MTRTLQVILLWTLHNAYAYQLTDISNNPGVITIKLADSFIINKYHTMVHFLNFSKLAEELKQTKRELRQFKTHSSHSVIYKQLEFIENKITNIIGTNTLKRNKRGLVNALGTAISWVTGNMDADDKDRYDRIINKLQENSYHLEHNVEHDITINKNLMKTFKQDIDILNRNNAKASNIFNSIDNYTHSIHLNELYSIINYITVRVTDIENSLEFCKLGILHSKILEQSDTNNVNKPLITKDLETLWLTSKVSCSIQNGVIHYLISIPLLSKKLSTLYFLSVPTKHQNNIVTTITPYNLVLYDNNATYTGNCTYIKTNYYCTNLILLHNKCINSLLLNTQTSCITTNVHSAPFVKFIEAINMYLCFKSPVVTLRSNTTYPLHIPSIALLRLSQNESLLEFNSPKQITIDSDIILPTTNVNTSYKMYNISFETLLLPSITNTQLEDLELYSSISYINYIVYILCILVTYLLFVHFKHLILNCKTSSLCNKPPSANIELEASHTEQNQNPWTLPRANFSGLQTSAGRT